MSEENQLQLENARAQMRKGILEYCILLIIGQGEAYASDIIEQMKQVRLLVVEGTLYPLLTRLKNDGLLQYNWVESQQGPPRKYFQLTEKGKLYLNALEQSWDELQQSVQSIKKSHNQQ